MKYFKDKLWNNINSLDEETKKRSRKRMEEKYRKIFCIFSVNSKLFYR